MKAPAIDPAGGAGVAASAALTMRRRWRAVLGALLLALTPGLASAAATEAEEWPTAADRGARSPTRIPWLRFSGDPAAPVVAPTGHAVHAHDVVVVREQELSRRQRRLLRRAQRHAEKAADLRARAGTHERRGTYATVVVPVMQAAPPAPPRPIVVRQARPSVQVVRLEHERESEDCDRDDDDDEDDDDDVRARAPVVIDGAKLSADVERQVEQALRAAERAHERAARAHERAERSRERSQRDAERARRPRR